MHVKLIPCYRTGGLIAAGTVTLCFKVNVPWTPEDMCLNRLHGAESFLSS